VTKRRRRAVLDNGQPAPTTPVRIMNGIALIGVSLMVLVPFLSIVSTSLAPRSQVNASGGIVLWPESLSFQAYAQVLEGGAVTRAMWISAFVTIVGTLISLTASAMLAYALARPGLRGRGAMLWTVLITLFFAPGIIPTFLVVKQVGLIDSIWSLILPTAVSGFNVIVLRAFFLGIPEELFDAAKIDGAGERRILTTIVLPLSRASLSVIGLFYAVGYWNAFFNALIYINDTTKWPLQMIVRSFVVDDSQFTTLDVSLIEQMAAPSSLAMAILVISIVPILIVYPFLQKNFAKGMLTGAVKG
jgi:multiple sugar transport system permease protein/putative aldouronate transport system permease protein